MHATPLPYREPRGTEYCFQVERTPHDFCGTVLRKPGAVVYRYLPSAERPRRSLTNPMRKRDCVFVDPSDQPVLTVRRASFLPSRFDIIDETWTVGSIAMLGILRNRSEIELRNGPTWLLHFPLFKVRYEGVSNEGRQLLVAVGSSLMQWYAFMDPGSDDPRLLCALAFIHNQRWNYG